MSRSLEEDADILVFDVPELRELARGVRAGGRESAQCFFELVRGIRHRARHDLTRACLLLWPDDASEEALREMVLLHLDAGAALEVKQLLALRADAELTLPARAVLALVEACSPSSANEANRRIWPNELLPYAAKTSIFHVQESIIARQRALISKLLAAASGGSG